MHLSLHSMRLSLQIRGQVCTVLVNLVFMLLNEQSVPAMGNSRTVVITSLSVYWGQQDAS